MIGPDLIARRKSAEQTRGSTCGVNGGRKEERGKSKDRCKKELEPEQTKRRRENKERKG